MDHTIPVLCEAVKSTDPPAQKVVEPLGVIVGIEGVGLIVTLTFDEFGHVPAVVYVTVYVPGVDALTSIAPRKEFKDNPAGELENVPPGRPVIDGV